jgi:hypothetical protein
MHFFHAMRCSLALEVVPLHRALKALALARARDIDGSDFLKNVDGQLLSDFHSIGRAAEFANESLRFAIGFGKKFDARFGASLRTAAVEFGDMPTFAASGQTSGFIAEAKLNRFVVIAIGRADLQHAAWAGFDHCHRNDGARLVKYLCHPDLAAE